MFQEVLLKWVSRQVWNGFYVDCGKKKSEHIPFKVAHHEFYIFINYFTIDTVYSVELFYFEI